MAKNSVSNREIVFQQYKRAVEQEQLVGYWLSTEELGISRRALMHHPQIQDVMLLIKYRDEFPDMNRTNKKRFDSIWKWCYISKYALKKKHLDWLELGALTTMAMRKKQARAQALIKANRG